MAKHHRGIGDADQGLGPDPNAYPEKLTDDPTAVTCRFAGEVFHEGDTICFKAQRWVCAAGSWNGTGQGC
jgi:hypothetical protein